MERDVPRSVFSSSIHFFSGTLVSRISGFLRDMAMAFFFGTSPALAAFFIAYRFIYLFRRLLGEGLLHQGFIPFYEGKKQESRRNGILFFRDFFWTAAALIFCFVLLFEIGLGTALISGWIGSSWIPVAHLSMLLLPGLFFITLFGLTSGFLQAENRFLLSGSAPVMLNVVWILGVLLLATLPIERAMNGLALFLCAGFLAQWSVTLPRVISLVREELKRKELFPRRLFSRQLRPLFRPILLGITGVAAMQVNSAVDAVFARFASPEGPAYLWYAIRMQQLPLALFGLALSSALLPALSRAVAAGDEGQFQKLLNFGVKRTFTLIFPCTVGIFVLGAVSVNLLFGRGGFTALSCVETTRCLWFYGFALLPAALVQILAPAFYARKEYKIPAIGFAASSCCNIALNAILVFGFGKGAASIALSTSVATLLNALFLFRHLYGKDLREVLPSAYRIAASALVAGGGTLFVGAVIFKDPTASMWGGGEGVFVRESALQMLHFAAQAGTYFVLLFALAKAFRASDLFQMFQLRSRPIESQCHTAQKDRPL